MNEYYYILITYTTYTHTNIYTHNFFCVHLIKIKRVYHYTKTKKTQQLFSFFFYCICMAC